MFNSDWLSKFALGVAIFTLIVLGAIWSGEQIEHNALLQEIHEQIKAYERNRDNKPSENLDRLAIAINNQSNSNHYQPDCRKKENVDPCAQLRMAHAAEGQADYTLYSLILLILTFVTAVVAAWAAYSAAKAGWKAAEVTREIGNDQIRPYVGFSEMLGRFEADGRIVIFAVVKNSGQSPARRVWATLEAHLVAAGKEPPRRFTKDKYVRQADIHPGDTPVIGDFVKTENGLTIDDVRAARAYVDVLGFITYRDKASRIHRTLVHSCLDITKCPSRPNGTYVIAGHPRGNYST